jgi:hypothetical protein
MLKVEIEGTTFTGHPTSTTFGNTNRMFFYTKFICKKAGIKACQLHAGDDVLLLLKKSASVKFKQTMGKYCK